MFFTITPEQDRANSVCSDLKLAPAYTSLGFELLTLVTNESSMHISSQRGRKGAQEEEQDTAAPQGDWGGHILPCGGKGGNCKGMCLGWGKRMVVVMGRGLVTWLQGFTL